MSLGTAVLVILAVIGGGAAFFYWSSQPYRHRGKSISDLPRFLLSFGCQFDDGTEVHIEQPRQGLHLVVVVRGSGLAKDLVFGDDSWPVSDPETPSKAAAAIARSLAASGWSEAADLVVWARGQFDPVYLDHLYSDLESTSRLPRRVRAWASRRRAAL
jgi:hypothetical protein